ncbi:hypothetical protein PGB90_007872 [Kerria lacca]
MVSSRKPPTGGTGGERGESREESLPSSELLSGTPTLTLEFFLLPLCSNRAASL